LIIIVIYALTLEQLPAVRIDNCQFLEQILIYIKESS